MKIDTAIPPRYRRNPISRHLFVRAQKNGGFDFSKPPLGNIDKMSARKHLPRNGFFLFPIGRGRITSICYLFILYQIEE